MPDRPQQHIRLTNRAEIIGILRALPEDESVVFLDSQLHTHPSSQTSYLFTRIGAILTYNSGTATISNGINGEIQTFQCDPWDAISIFRKKYPGYACGYLGYDLKNYRERLSSDNPDAVGLPEMWLGRPEVIYEMVNTGSVDEPLVGSDPVTDQIRIDFVTAREHYLQKVNRAQDHIREGDVYEINLSHQIISNFDGDAVRLYESMRNRGPVPYAAFLRLHGVEICCASPERFLKKTSREIVSDPIKGTRPRGGNVREDEDIREQLFTSEKDKAENLMIVDLVRNDFNRVCKPGSVKVDSLFEIQSFGTVHQMVSRISGVLNDEVSTEESIASCFPMGSMTGAPKIRSMEIIEELEDYKRGVYSGTIGYFSPDGDYNFNVVIRSAIIKNNRLYYATGGAITSDSDPNAEWEETLVKIRALGTNLAEPAE